MVSAKEKRFILEALRSIPKEKLDVILLRSFAKDLPVFNLLRSLALEPVDKIFASKSFIELTKSLGESKEPLACALSLVTSPKAKRASLYLTEMYGFEYFYGFLLKEFYHHSLLEEEFALEVFYASSDFFAAQCALEFFSALSFVKKVSKEDITKTSPLMKKVLSKNLNTADLLRTLDNLLFLYTLSLEEKQQEMAQCFFMDGMELEEACSLARCL